VVVEFVRRNSNVRRDAVQVVLKSPTADHRAVITLYNSVVLMLTATADPFPMTLLPSSSNGGDCPILLFAANLPTTSDTTHVGIIMCGTVRYNTLFLNVGRRAEQLDGRRDHGPSTQEMSLVIFGQSPRWRFPIAACACVCGPAEPS
jgi:hypothetical protein